MVDLAQQNTERYIPLKDIAERQGISKKYLEIIVKELVSSKLLIGVSGKGGGYRLARKADEYSVGEILEVTEGSLAVVVCLADENYNCPRKDFCDTLPMWKEYNDIIYNFFYNKKLSDLL